MVNKHEYIFIEHWSVHALSNNRQAEAQCSIAHRDRESAMRRIHELNSEQGPDFQKILGQT